MDINEIMKYLPHRYPFLLVDRILEIGEAKIVGMKNVTINEPFFQGHFPGHPIMPGVLIIEAMAQVGGIFAFKSMNATPETKVVYFMGIDGARFRKPVLPGDQIRFELELLKKRGTVYSFKGRALVDGTLVAEAELLATIVDK
ncbi:MAG: 3-hydroxyacyl-[acyl-carrier-protein] dehydratase, FabZ form [Deltaproteobacteria bacterium]|nr:3-hydroxyacyl-[acyl-carrier-protein] dehydratase, FabZ form [Deltaproteobacteria bacterium]